MMRRRKKALVKDERRGRMRQQENESRVGCGLEKVRSDGQSSRDGDFSAHARL